MKYKFTGKISYQPKKGREWYFQEEKFNKTVEAKTQRGAELKLQTMMMAHVKHPIGRFVIDYECEAMNEAN